MESELVILTFWEGEKSNLFPFRFFVNGGFFMEEIDVETLRADLMDYYGTAIPYYPQAILDLGRIESASEEEVVNIAVNSGFDLDDYKRIKGRRF